MLAHLDLQSGNLVTLQQDGFQVGQFLKGLEQIEWSSNFVITQVHNFKIDEGLDVFDPSYLVLAEDQCFQMDEVDLEIVDLGELVRAQVEEVKVGQTHQILNLGYLIAMQVHVLDSLLSFEQWDVRQVPSVQAHLVGIDLPLRWSTVHDQDAWNLWQFDKDGEGLRLNKVYVSVLEQVTIPLILLLFHELAHETWLHLEHLRSTSDSE